MSSSRHKSKRKSSRAATSCSHPSKRAKSPRTTPRKRRKSHNATNPNDNLFAIKDIIDEKIVDGKRYYQIDWADNPTTGQSYSPTWVCSPVHDTTSQFLLTPLPGARGERQRGRRRGLEVGTATSSPTWSQRSSDQ